MVPSKPTPSPHEPDAPGFAPLWDASLRSFIEFLPAPAFITDEQRIVRSANRRALDLLGAELVGHPFRREGGAETSSAPDELHLALADGKTLTLLDHFAPIDGGSLHLLVDITEREHLEEALKAGDERLQRMVEESPAMIWTADAGGAVTYASNAWYEYTGLSSEHDHDWERLVVHPDDLPRRRAAWDAAMREGKPYEAELRLRRSDGTYRWFISRAVPIRDARGRIVQWVGGRMDIEERKRAEGTSRFLAEASAELAGLTQVEATLKRLAQLAVPYFADWCTITIRDGHGAIRRIAVHHADPQKLVEGDELAKLFPLVVGQGPIRVLETGLPVWVPRITEEVLEKSGLTEPQAAAVRKLDLVSYLCVPMLARDRIIGTLSFATSESAHSYSESDLRAAEDLARRAAIAIENAELIQALQDADRRKDEFLAVLAHELRNPLAPVKNAVHIIRTLEAPNPELQWAHDVIDRQIEHMSRLVDDLLDVSRITSGRIELRRERVALAEIVNAAVDASRPLMERRQHVLSVKLPEEPIYLEADRTRLGQVFLNLLNNAAKYTNPGGHIWIGAEREIGYAAIRIVDNGAGIPPAMLDRIFDMFMQVDRGAENAQGGLGIGLTIVKRLVEMHGGTIEARSEGPERGSEFIVRLPIVDAKPLAASSEDARPPNAKTLASLRVLVVDDNTDAADSLSMLLRSFGHEVKVAYDGLEAVGAAIAFRPDVALLDIGLPKLYGYDAAKRIREALGPGVLLIAITGWGQEDDRRRSHEAGFDHHLTKPVDFNRLLALMAERTPDSR
jgi:PAS domain S-box-containing protein